MNVADIIIVIVLGALLLTIIGVNVFKKGKKSPCGHCPYKKSCTEKECNKSSVLTKTNGNIEVSDEENDPKIIEENNCKVEECEEVSGDNYSV